MTILQVLNSAFYLVIYPYLIRTLGAEHYGQYVFGFSLAMYFTTLVTFGFDMPALKSISLNADNAKEKSYTVSCITSAKLYIELVSVFIFAFLVMAVPSFRSHWLLYTICFLQSIVNIIFPQWYFQGIQKMKIVTYIQIVFKLLSLPFIFLLVKQPDDVWLFALISTLSSIIGGVVAVYVLLKFEKIHFQFIPLRDLKAWFKDGLPFFWTYFFTTIKQQTVPIIIGSYFGMRDVAIYDLGYKIFSIPFIFMSSVNGALFPKLINNSSRDTLKKVFRYETLAGISVVIIIALIGPTVIKILAGSSMLDAYPISVVLSFGVLNFLLVSAYINFIFIPNNKYYLITQNQIVAFVVFYVLLIGSLLIHKSILLIAISWACAALFEILYCNILIRKNNLFN